MQDLIETNSSHAPCQKEQHTRRKIRALMIINLFVTDKIIPYIEHLCDPRKIWTKFLYNLYEFKIASCRLLIRSKLINLKMEEDTLMENNLEPITDLLNQLAGFGEKIARNVVVEIVLNTSPKKPMNVVSFELASHAYIA
jgi:hypothetical protein